MTDQEAKKIEVTHIGNDRGPAWVREMHAHYASTGTFRASDVRRVLGDVRTVVGMPAKDGLSAAALLLRR